MTTRRSATREASVEAEPSPSAIHCDTEPNPLGHLNQRHPMNVWVATTTRDVDTHDRYHQAYMASHMSGGTYQTPLRHLERFMPPTRGTPTYTRGYTRTPLWSLL